MNGVVKELMAAYPLHGLGGNWASMDAHGVEGGDHVDVVFFGALGIGSGYLQTASHI